MTLPLSVDYGLYSLAEVIGTVPPGDTPAAWYASTDAEVIKGWLRFREDAQHWQDRLAELCALSGWDSKGLRTARRGEHRLEGLYVDLKGEPVPRWWREAKGHYLVPRARTKAEKTSEVAHRFQALRNIPEAVDYLPDMPHSMWHEGRVYTPIVRRTAQAVLVFFFGDPDTATQPFEVGPQWARMKMSTFHLLRERQAAAQEVQ